MCCNKVNTPRKYCLSLLFASTFSTKVEYRIYLINQRAIEVLLVYCFPKDLLYVILDQLQMIKTIQDAYLQNSIRILRDALNQHLLVFITNILQSDIIFERVWAQVFDRMAILLRLISNCQVATGYFYYVFVNY